MFLSNIALLSCTGHHTPTQDSLSAIRKGKAAVASGDFETAAVYFNTVYTQYQKGESGDSIPEALEYGGNVNALLGNYVKALDFYICAIEAAERNGNDKVYAYCHNNIALLYALFGNYAKASRYLETACEMATQTNDANLLGISATNLVRASSYTGDAMKARKYFQLQQEHPLQDEKRQSYYLLFNQGLIYSAEKDYAKGIECLKEALRHIPHVDRFATLATPVYTELGRIYATSGANDSAAYYLRKVITTEATPENKMTAYKMLAGLPNSDNTVDYQAEYIALSDSVFNRAQFDSMCDKLFILEKTRTDNQTKSLQQWILFLCAVILFILSMLAILIVYHKKLKTVKTLLVSKNQQLIHKNDELELSLTRLSGNGDDPKPEKVTPIQDGNDQPEAKQGQQINLSEERQTELKSLIEQQLADLTNIQNQDYSLALLAEQIGSNTRYVSFVINNVFKKTFKTLLNEYRIRESCRRLTGANEYSQLTIAAIAQSVGYNSVNNFINTFKKVNGVTPSQYRKLADQP